MQVDQLVTKVDLVSLLMLDDFLAGFHQHRVMRLPSLAQIYSLTEEQDLSSKSQVFRVTIYFLEDSVEAAIRSALGLLARLRLPPRRSAADFTRSVSALVPFALFLFCRY